MHYHANTRTNATDAKALAPAYADMDAARTAVLVGVGQWVGTHTYRRVTEATAWDAPQYSVAAYDSSTGEARTWSAWGCTCSTGEVAVQPTATTCSTCGRDGVTGPHSVTGKPGSALCTGQPVPTFR